jgi:lipid II:glycine glycyltransferase (peptidoglycan interpeptide bridge formation enzyme)
VSPDPGEAVLQEWDRFVDSVPGSDVAQLSAWARIRQEAGYRPLYLLAQRDGQVVGGALVLERRLPVVGRFGYVSNGPLVSPAVAPEPVIDRLVAMLDDLARSRLRALFVQPPANGHEIGTRLRRRGFRQSSAGIAPAASIRVDLRRDIEDLHKRLTKANRRRTRNWARRGVNVRVGSPADAGRLADLLARTAEHQNFEPLSPDYVQRLHRELDSDRHAVVFVAELDDDPVAALLCTRCGGTVKQRISGMDRSERARKDGVSAATVWTAMLWAKDHGYHTYDFGGLREDAARQLLSGRTEQTVQLTGSEQFKTSFGGEAFLYPGQVELISSPPLRLAYDFSRRTRIGARMISIGKRVLRGGHARGRRHDSRPRRR